jgi:uncharacterized cupin superfamily protein
LSYVRSPDTATFGTFGEARIFNPDANHRLAPQVQLPPGAYRRMHGQNISISSTEIVLDSAPINREWVIKGSPEARNQVIFKSRDGNSWTMVWECTAGSFNWSYDCDETVHIIEGRVLLTTGSETRELQPGDVIFFPAGSSAIWQVDDYVRKIAFLRQSLPPTLGILMKILRKAKRINARYRSPPPLQSIDGLGHSAQI